MSETTLEKSKGHLGFIRGREYFEFNGSVCSADSSRMVMPDGYRPALFECYRGQWERLRSERHNGAIRL